MSDQPDLEYYMDYQDVKFICAETFDPQLRVLMASQTPEFNRRILCYTPDEEARHLPFCLTSAAHYSLGRKFYSKRGGINSYQVILTTGGSGIVHTQEGDFRCFKGTVMVLDGHSPHMYKSGEEGLWDYKHVHFFTNGGGETVAQKALGFTECSGNVEQYLDGVFAEFEKLSATSAFVFSNLISCMLTEILLLRSRRKKPDTHQEMLEKAAAYLREHYGEKVSVADIARDEYLSIYYFIRLFKDYFGMSPYVYLINYRVNRAKEKLLLGEPVEEIAHTCGFGNPNNFFRVFKKHSGMTPNRFRSQYSGHF